VLLRAHQHRAAFDQGHALGDLGAVPSGAGPPAVVRTPRPRPTAGRPSTDADLTAIRAVNLAAFPTSEEADLVDALRADPAA
jgi:hypothetical protein